jgi:hypothetical protein
MRLDVDEREFEDLEIRLRRSAVGRRPEVPDELLRFIDTVPGSYRRRSRLVIGFGRPRVRAGIAFAATAAALVVAIVAGQALVSVRNGQPGASIDPGAPVTGSGWTWQRADGVAQMHSWSWTTQGYRVANGYIGTCDVDGKDGWQLLLCSSPDGLRWSTPPDPKIVTFDGQSFMPDDVVQVGSTYVATGSASPDLWRSTDGIHWQVIDSSTIADRGTEYLGLLNGVFADILLPDASDPNWWLVTSTDGLTWTKTSQLGNSFDGSALFGADRLYGLAASGGYEVTQDGKTWNSVQFPDGFAIRNVFALPGGGFVAGGAVTTSVASGAFSNTSLILRSTDGLTWQIASANLPADPSSLAVSGGRLFVSTYVSPSPSTQSSAAPSATAVGSTAPAPFETEAADMPIWQSADGGQTWQPLQDSMGRQLSGLVAMQNGRVAISTGGADTYWHLAWVGTPPATIGWSTADTAPIQAQACSIQDKPSSPPLQAEVGGLSGWQEVDRWWSSQAQSGACGYGTDKRAGASVAVVGTCQGSGVLHVSLDDQTSVFEQPSGDTTTLSATSTPNPMSPPPVLASFDVQCPLSESSPVVAFASTSADYVGKALAMNVTVDGDVSAYSLLLQTADGSLTSGSPLPTR